MEPSPQNNRSSDGESRLPKFNYGQIDIEQGGGLIHPGMNDAVQRSRLIVSEIKYLEPWDLDIAILGYISGDIDTEIAASRAGIAQVRSSLTVRYPVTKSAVQEDEGDHRNGACDNILSHYAQDPEQP